MVGNTAAANRTCISAHTKNECSALVAYTVPGAQFSLASRTEVDLPLLALPENGPAVRGGAEGVSAAALSDKFSQGGAEEVVSELWCRLGRKDLLQVVHAHLYSTALLNKVVLMCFFIGNQDIVWGRL